MAGDTLPDPSQAVEVLVSGNVVVCGRPLSAKPLEYCPGKFVDVGGVWTVPVAQPS